FGANYILNKKTNPVKAFIYIGLFICGVFILIFLKKDGIFTLFPLPPLRLMEWLNDLYVDGIFILLATCFSLLFLILYITGLIRRSAFILAFMGIIIIDLFFFGKELNPLVKRELYDKSDTIRIFSKKEGLFRINLSPKTAQYFTVIRGKTLQEAIENSKRFVIPNTSMVFRIFEGGIYDSIYLSDYFQLKEKMAKTPFSSISKLLSMMNIRFIISKERLLEKDIRLVYQDRDMFLYENPFWFERAFVVYNYRTMQKNRVLEYMLSPQFHPEREVVLEEEVKSHIRSILRAKRSKKSKVTYEVSCERSEAKSQKSKCKIIDYQPNRVVIEVETKEPGLLFLSDTYYPGWKAYISHQSSLLAPEHQKEVRIYRANYCFRAVEVDKGRQLVEFRYFPRTFIIGLIASLVSFVLILGAFLLYMFSYPNKSYLLSSGVLVGCSLL
ncbi:MAG: YfhO family protein, partial [bacterium]